ncbi:uncharacterized protein LOC127287545 [Leptopilina boulardi]|uniref:uncharacterized protein LOC127287545 n=1 Tax=Leptopilina boulardi TaxID=63433 RepID=UPI0021F54539|nr:uncharacterized protein LOC127287545 [Leptopilina boulardi]
MATNCEPNAIEKTSASNKNNSSQSKFGTSSAKQSSHASSSSQLDDFIITDPFSTITEEPILVAKDLANEIASIIEKKSKANLETIEERLGFLENECKLLHEKQDQILAQNERIMNQNAQILELLQKGVSTNTQLQTTLFQLLQGLPLSNLEDYHKFISEENNDRLESVHNHLVQIGETKLREFLNYSLKQLTKDELVSQFSWPGSSNSEKFGDTKISNLLYESSKNCKSFVTKQRYRNNLKKVNSNIAENIPINMEEENPDDEELLRRIEELENSEIINLDEREDFSEDEAL